MSISWVKHASKLVRCAKYRQDHASAIISGVKMIAGIKKENCELIMQIAVRIDIDGQYLETLPDSSRYLSLTSLDLHRITKLANPDSMIAEVQIPNLEYNIKHLPLTNNTLCLYSISDSGTIQNV